MTINDYLAYADYFSQQKYDDYYTEDVVVELPSQTLRGKQELKVFYEHLRPYIHETLRVKKVLIDGDTIAAQVYSDFYCLQDYPDFSIRPMKKGDLIRAEMFVFYTLRNGKFSHIKACRFKVHN
jgi:hypothetical protein